MACGIGQWYKTAELVADTETNAPSRTQPVPDPYAEQAMKLLGIQDPDHQLVREAANLLHAHFNRISTEVPSLVGPGAQHPDPLMRVIPQRGRAKDEQPEGGFLPRNNS